MATFYHTEPHFTSNVQKFLDTVSKDAVADFGCLGATYGPVVEEIEKEGDGKGKGNAVLLCIGWESREDHMKFRESESFKKNIHFLREGMGGIEMHHTVFKSYKDS